MTKAEFYTKELKNLSEWDLYLKQNSGLPGPRANLELLQAVCDLGTEELFNRYIKYDESAAPVSSPEEFLSVCGVAGLGKLAAEGKERYYAVLGRYAADSRWRIREAVAIALQYAGDRDWDSLFKNVESWKQGNLLEQRALIAALCEPRLLKIRERAARVLEILDHVTKGVESITDRKRDSFAVLKKGLAYCWSVAAVEYPEKGKELIEKWAESSDKDIRWIIRENLKKNRLIKMDRQWVDEVKYKLSDNHV
ncbi:MAG: hypothetical protein ACOY46_09460 [Bacillota bacterium]